MTQAKLRTYTKKELAGLAKKRGIPGWHAMRKEQLVRALAASNGRQGSSAKPRSGRRSSGPASSTGRRSKTTARSTRKRAGRTEPAASATRADSSPAYQPSRAPTDLARSQPGDLPDRYGKDRVVLMVRDPYWLHAYWEITRQSVQRAEAALREAWHTAKPVLRLVDVSSEETTSSAERALRDIEIHSDVNNWYIDVTDPPRSYRVDIGYLTREGDFYALAHSNVVTTPRAGVSNVIDENWVSLQEEFEKIYAMSASGGSEEFARRLEQRMLRLMGSGAVSSLGSGLMPQPRRKGFWFELDAELIVYGATEPAAKVTLQGEPVQLRPDGTFTMRFGLPNRRQIIPAVARSPDGNEERTIVLAVERNTKELEPVIHDGR